MTVAEARAALAAAEDDLAAAQHVRDDAREALDLALAAAGWTRLPVAGASGAVYADAAGATLGLDGALAAAGAA